VEEKHTLLDKAKMAYTEKLQEGSMLSEQSGEVQPQGGGEHCDLSKRHAIQCKAKRLNR